jgi:hypothetical protein
MIRDETPEAEARRTRLEPVEKGNPLRPFARAVSLTDISLYWMPIPVYPIASSARKWLLEFLKRLSVVMAARSFRTETFLLFKALYPDLLDRFLKTSSEYSPMTGLSVQPGVTPPAQPSMEDVEAEVRKGGKIDVNKWMADYCFWFINKQAAEQREDFLGFGGMLVLFMASDAATKPPDIRVPKAARTHPAFDKDFEAKLSSVFSMKDGFLKKSKEVFGEPLRADPAYDGIPFVIPLLRAEDLLSASAETREEWFGVFDGYCLESKADKGLLLAMKDQDFNEKLRQLLVTMRNDGLEYPL